MLRFIPTSVGNTIKSVSSLTASAVHPHKRGEHGCGATIAVCGAGSSPQAWGTRCASRSRARLSRFIPTSVGNTATSVSLMNGQTGSSPQAWGTRVLSNFGAYLQARNIRQFDEWANRFIPTSVGNTSCHKQTRWQRPVHPHKRGEHKITRLHIISTFGSSPQAWGTPFLFPRPDFYDRFIPTSVGNTRT